ncbi:ABC transporter substrate-binding protein [Streptomyces sp. NPDC056821]|uniref:ABC transporter substrate-binding protein n=1 Tax=unclassified Streptomyces TaxID=2593676 RepID=UPI0036A644CC
MKRVVVLGIAGTALLTAACNGGAPKDSQGAPGAGGSKQVTMAVQSLPDTLTIAPWGGTPSQLVLSGLGSQLAAYNGASANGCGPVTPSAVSGLLADSITVDPDHKAVTVKLKPLKSQTGNTLSAQDVAWSFVDYGFVAQPVLKKTFAVAGYDTDHLVTVVDKHTVKLNIKSYNSYTDQMLQNPLASVYDSTEAKKHVTSSDPIAHDWLAKNLADYSGWKLDSFTPGQSLAVVANSDWGGPQRKIDRLALQAVPADATRQVLITSGQAQVASGFQFDQYKTLSADASVKVQNCPGLNMDDLMLSTKTPPLDDVRVRQAISMAINRKQIADGAYFGFATPAQSSFNKGFGLGTFGDAYTFDVAKAKALLAEAGHPNGFPLTLTYSTSRPGPVAARTAVLLQSMLKQIGITVTLRPVASPTDFSTAVLGGSYQAVLYGEPPVIADPAYLAWIKFGSNSPNNTTGWKNADFDTLRGKLASTPATDTATRTDLLKKLAEIGDTQVPVIYLVETSNMVVTAKQTTQPPLPNGPIRFDGIGS